MGPRADPYPPRERLRLNIALDSSLLKGEASPQLKGSYMIQRISTRAASILLLCIGCGGDTSADSSGGDGSGCENCDDGVQVYACYCDVDPDPTAYEYEIEECPPAPPSNSDQACNARCESNHGDDTPSDVRDPPCAAESSMSCTSWSPSSYITYSSGVYHVDGDWLSGVVSDPEPLWGCDDALISPYAVGQFKIEGASSGEALYELGLRTGDIPVVLNGQSLGTFAGAFTAFSQYLGGETEYTLVVLRSGVPFALSYEID